MARLPFLLLVVATSAIAQPKHVVIFTSGIEDNSYAHEWREALRSRMLISQLDSLSGIKRALTPSETLWQNLIRSKTSRWSLMLDSLRVPFGKTVIPDTIFVMAGFLGDDDGFTFRLNTVCLDVTAFQKNYGEATLAINDNRIDRIFAHEFTHVIHKNWVKQNNVHIKDFRDSILWECLYEGIGTYRSLSGKWLPKNGVVPTPTKEALANLYPIFYERMKLLHSKKSFSSIEKHAINQGLSRGQIDKKWGAFTVAIWLALEANGDDRNLIPWIEKGTKAVLELADKYNEAVFRSK